MFVMLDGMSTPARNPVSRRERPAKPALTRDGIVAAAVAVMREHGLERVTMRRVAQKLDTGAASLYVYVADVAELHAGILDELLGEVDLRPAGGDWRERLTGVLLSYTRVLFGHPALARSALVTRPSGPHYLDLLETLLALLAEGGVLRDRAAWGVDALLLFATAAAAEQGTRNATPETEQDMAAVVAAVRNVDPRDYPQLAATGDELFSGTGEARLDWHFRLLINGMTQTPR